MKNSILIVLLAISITANAQQANTSGPKIGWFVTPEIGGMFLENHIGRTVGVSLGLKLWKNRLKIGIHGYGRSGPINPHTFSVTPYAAQTYKGQSTLKLRNDHGTIGVLIAPTFRIKNIELDIPLNAGLVAGGYYLVGEDRVTPDGQRTSVWENKLMNGEDASAGGWIEAGVRAFFPTKIKGMQLGFGLHYMTAQGWKTYADPEGDYANNKIRASLFVNFGTY